MQPTKITEADRTSEIAPSIRHLVPWRVVSVTARPGMLLEVSFVDGTQGEVDLGPFLRGPKVKGTVFEPLRESGFFDRASVQMGAVQWPNGADLAPDRMHDEIVLHGRWVVD